MDAKENKDNFKTCVNMLNNLKNEFNKNKNEISLCKSYDDYKNNKMNGKISAF